MVDPGDYQKKDKKTQLEVLTSPDQYEGKDTSRNMSELEDLRKSSVKMRELVVRTLLLINYRLSILKPCDKCYDRNWHDKHRQEFCCVKNELEDSVRNMDIPEELWKRRTEHKDTAEESIEFFYNDIAGDLIVIDQRLMHILGEEPYNIIDRRDYSVEKMLRKTVWDNVTKALKDLEIKDLQEIAKPVEEIGLEKEKPDIIGGELIEWKKQEQEQT